MSDQAEWERNCREAGGKEKILMLTSAALGRAALSLPTSTPPNP